VKLKVLYQDEAKWGLEYGFLLPFTGILRGLLANVAL
jgi:hypothetical protein